MSSRLRALLIAVLLTGFGLVSTSGLAAVAAGPEATLVAPTDQTVVSPIPTFVVQATDAASEVQSVEIEVDQDGLKTSFNSDSFDATGVTSRTVPLDLSLSPGAYTWRARATNTDAEVGDWSAPRSFTVSGAIDVASYAGPIAASVWDRMRERGWTSVIVAAWQGRSKNPYAHQQLQAARSASMKTAAYCLLNFDRSDQSGKNQMEQALAAVGDEGPFLQFMAVDVEDAYPPAGFSPSSPDAGQQADAAQRVREAVEMAQDAGLQPIIYTTRTYWLSITGLTGDGENPNPFSVLPLWTANYHEYADSTNGPHALDDLAVDWNGTREAPWRPFGGWDRRVGKQYADNTSKTAKALQGAFGIPSMDLDVITP